jgi:CheY-like chemotaxis protein
MPRKSGLALLEEIKADLSLRMLPVVMFTASRYEEDIGESYSRGACSFVEKPPRFEWFQEVATCFANYWTCVAYLPTRSGD